MFRIASDKELVQAFRPRDRKVLELPAGQTFPIIVRGSMTWLQPAGVYGYLLFQDPTSKQPLGLVFRRDGSTDKTLSGRICDWCQNYGNAEQVGMLMCEKSSKRQVGLFLCRDLQCASRVEDQADRAGRNTKDMLEKLHAKMWQFANQGLGIETVPND